MNWIKSKRIIEVSVLFLVFFAGGWGEDGHRIVGQIAWLELANQPATQQAIQAILDGDSSSKYHSLAGAALWADDIKRVQGYGHLRTLHYVNVPDGAQHVVPGRDCENGCVFSAIEENADILVDSDAGEPARLEALKLLAHFVGDIHQPLHAGRKSDKGGNGIQVEFRGRQVNLHSLWDTTLIKSQGKAPEVYAQELFGAITPAQRGQWAGETDPARWANESYHLAVSNAYKIPQSHRISQRYATKNIAVIETQLKIAGVRLAALLQRSLTPSLPPDSAENVDGDDDGEDPSGVRAMPSGRRETTGPRFGPEECLAQAKKAMNDSRALFPANLSASLADETALGVFRETFKACMAP